MRTIKLCSVVFGVKSSLSVKDVIHYVTRAASPVFRDQQTPPLCAITYFMTYFSLLSLNTVSGVS